MNTEKDKIIEQQIMFLRKQIALTQLQIRELVARRDKKEPPKDTGLFPDLDGKPKRY